MENGKEFKGVPDETSVGLSAASPRPVTGSGLSASIPHAKDEPIVLHFGEVLVFVDEPVVLLCTDEHGRTHLVTRLHESDHPDDYIAVMIGHKRYTELSLGEICLRTAIVECEERVWRTYEYSPANEFLIIRKTMWHAPERMLPKSGFLLCASDAEGGEAGSSERSEENGTP